MKTDNGTQRLLHLKKQWRLTALLTNAVWALGISFLVVLFLQQWSDVHLAFVLVVFAVLLPLILFINRSWQIQTQSISRHLNANYPVLEESAQLLLPSGDSLTLLQQLQRAKVNEQFNSIEIRSPFRKPLLWSLLFLLISCLAMIAVHQFSNKNLNRKGEENELASITKRKEVILPTIKTAEIIITPPSYIKSAIRRQDRFNLRAETGAQVTWQLALNTKAVQVSLQFNDGTTVSLQETGTNYWSVSKTVRQSGFYQVKIDNQLSELYLIEAIKDLPPSITVQSPAPSLSVEFEGAQKFLLQAKVTDDHSISRLQLSATIASGQGEAVKFREQKFGLPLTIGAREQPIQKWMDCRSLKMQPGDELYLWLSATDSYGQETRSDVLIVSLQDITVEITIDGLLKGLDVKPELFRSQRQIIIESEQLLRNKSKITTTAFQEKSNELGTDQKLLRLRYGKFLGEEFSSEIGGDHHEEEHSEPQDEAAALLDLYSHKHDNAEDATFFDPTTKKQLKAMLNEMWNAELKLRTFLPKEALVYEYKALRLLKDLQQKSRAYVPKTSFTPTPLQMEKRLSGDVSKVENGWRQQSLANEDPLLVVRKSIGLLEEIKTTGQLPTASIHILQSAYQQLSSKAAAQPAVYLPGVSGFRKILNDDFRVADIKAAQKGLQQMLPPPTSLPYSSKRAPGNLSQSYFDHLKKSRN